MFLQILGDVNQLFEFFLDVNVKILSLRNNQFKTNLNRIGFPVHHNQ